MRNGTQAVPYIYFQLLGKMGEFFVFFCDTKRVRQNFGKRSGFLHFPFGFFLYFLIFFKKFTKSVFSTHPCQMGKVVAPEGLSPISLPSFLRSTGNNLF